MALNHLYLDTMKLKTLAEDVKGLQWNGPSDVEITGLACDSRQVRPGYLFAALPGARRDGGDFIGDALRRGAAAVLSEDAPRPGNAGLPHLQVPDARRALAEMACVFFEHPSRYLRLVGVTGTNGKTTTAYLVKQIFAAAGRRPGLLGTVRYEIGEREIPATRTTPEAPDIQAYLRQMLVAGCQSAVMEVSSHALVQHRTWGLDFDVGIFTNLTEEHLDYHGDMERYFAAKSRLFHGLGQREKKAVAVINTDDPWGRRLPGVASSRVQEITFGSGPDALVRAEHACLDIRGSAFLLRTPWGDAPVTLPLPGRYNVANALAACAACGALGVDPGLMASALARARGAPGRMEAVSNDRGLHVYVDYAHTPDALQQALAMLRECGSRRILAVFGCGGDRDRAKRPVMGQIAVRLADYVIVTTDNARTENPAEIAGEILAGMANDERGEMVLDRGEAIARAVELARPGDTILIAGKGHENVQEIGRSILPFDDREVARALLS